MAVGMCSLERGGGGGGGLLLLLFCRISKCHCTILFKDAQECYRDRVLRPKLVLWCSRDDRDTILLLNSLTDIVNYWQEMHSKSEAEEKFSGVATFEA